MPRWSTLFAFQKFKEDFGFQRGTPGPGDLQRTQSQEQLKPVASAGSEAEHAQSDESEEGTWPELDELDEDSWNGSNVPSQTAPPGGPWRIGEFVFFSCFDSGNCLRVDESKSSPGTPSLPKGEESQKEQESLKVQQHEMQEEKERAQGQYEERVDQDEHQQSQQEQSQLEQQDQRDTREQQQKPCQTQADQGQQEAKEATDKLMDAPKLPGPRAKKKQGKSIPRRRAEASAWKPETEGIPVFYFDVRIRADCAGTAFQRSDCQWFYFGMQGHFAAGCKLRFQVFGLSRFKSCKSSSVRAKFLLDGLLPVVRARSHSWNFIAGSSGVRQVEEGPGGLAFTFEHVVQSETDLLFFAMTFPYPLKQVRRHMISTGRRLKEQGNYAHLEHLCNSFGGRPVELLTITGPGGSCGRLPALCLDGDTGKCPRASQRPRHFRARKAVFISSRVHPGETPASFMLKGLLDFLASGCAASKALLQRYVFFILPVLNPDGVELGHHRTDLKGENLNRVYGSANFVDHPSIAVAEAACRAADQHQGGLRLFLDFHAHSVRRGAFLLGDAQSSDAEASAKLFAYALARRSETFEYSQSDFFDAVAGTGKTTAAATGQALCFTVETNYCRGHHSAMPFTPEIWCSLGQACLEALLDVDLAESTIPRHLAPLPPSLVLACERHCTDLQEVSATLRTKDNVSVAGPSRALPYFATVLGPTDDFIPSQYVWRNPELIGKEVEVIDWQPEIPSRPRLCRLHDCDGGVWLQESDLRFTAAQRGCFFYGSLRKVEISDEVQPSSASSRMLLQGTVIEAHERRVCGGKLRLKIACSADDPGGWVSEYCSNAFDPRLGGRAQLMRLSGPQERGIPGRQRE